MRYRVTDADQATFPARYATEARHLGYDHQERERPFARFMAATTVAPQDQVTQALLSGMAPTEYGYPLRDCAARLERSGYEPLETGWTRTAGHVVFVAALTRMPGVTAAMWDWWFGWHGAESARYKLWHPDAHQFCAMGANRGPELPDRARYLDNVSYVDEYIGGTLQRLAIRFVDASTLGFEERPQTTVICARVGFSGMPVAFGWLVHQVRPTSDGCEMRSRFFLNVVEVLRLPVRALPHPGTARLARPFAGVRVPPPISERLLPAHIGPDLLHHCGSEMNHLSGFLPALYEDFRGTP